MKSSKITAGSEIVEFRIGWLGDIDRRTALYRSLNARLSQLYRDLGGYDNLTTQQRVLCERAVFIECQLRSMETAALDQGVAIDLGRYGFLSNVLTGLLKTLGLHRPQHLALNDDMAAAWRAALDTGSNYEDTDVLAITDQSGRPEDA